MDSRTMLTLVRDQIRAVVDPMVLKLRQDLFGSPFSGELKGSLIPKSIISEAVNEGISDAAEGLALVPIVFPYTAGSTIQFGKAVYFDSGQIHHADCSNSSHAGKIIGISTSSGGSGDTINVQAYGVLESDFLSLGSGTGALMVGNNGSLVKTLPVNASFVSYTGIGMSSTKLFVFVTPEVYII